MFDFCSCVLLGIFTQILLKTHRCQSTPITNAKMHTTAQRKRRERGRDRGEREKRARETRERKRRRKRESAREKKRVMMKSFKRMQLLLK